MQQTKERVLSTAINDVTLNDIATELLLRKGFSYNLPTRKLATNRGYFASIEGKDSKFYLSLSHSDLIERLRTFIEDNIDELNSRNIYFGGWIDDDNKCYLDISVKFSNIRAARSFAQHNNQLAIYDAFNQKSIYL